MYGFYAVVDYCPIKLNDLEINACSVHIANLLAPYHCKQAAVFTG